MFKLPSNKKITRKLYKSESELKIYLENLKL